MNMAWSDMAWTWPKPLSSNWKRAT